MTGSDDGGFKPHPGDPWHPDFEDAESPEEGVAPQPDDLGLESEQPRKKKGKRYGRRGRRSDKGAAEADLDLPTAESESGSDEDGEPSHDGAAESDPAPTITASETGADEDGEASNLDLSDVGDDPIDVGLEIQEEIPGRSSEEDENVPVPAWTSDHDPDPEKLLSVEQPSWVGQTTEASPGVEAVGFEPTAVSDDQPPPDDVPESQEAEEEPGLIGQYGVAGPEAFDALGEDDASTGELDDWGAFLEGSQPSSDVVEPGEAGDAIGLVDPQVGDEAPQTWTAPAPKKRRGLFRRAKRDQVEEVVDDGFVGSVSGEEAAAETEFAPSHFGTPEELPAGGGAFDEWVESDPEQRQRLVGGDKPDRPEESVEHLYEDAAPATGLDDGSIAAVAPEPGSYPIEDVVAEDLVIPAQTDETIDGVQVDDSVGSQDSQEDAATDTAGQGQADSTLGEQPDLFGDSQDFAPTPEPSTDPGSGAEVDAAPATVEPVELGDTGLDDDQDWEGDPGRVPAAWFAEIDEDEVLPPTSAEAPETEWPDALDGPRDLDQGQVASTDLFDVEDPIDEKSQSEAVAQEETVPVPEGYEPWHQAVTDAVELEAAADQHADDGTYEYDQPALQDSDQASEGPSAEGLPAGFEPFPGGAAPEQFELPEETLRDELSAGGLEPGWVTEQMDPGQMPTEEMDSAFPADQELDEQIYAAGGTIEHRDLAAAIAEAGNEDTQWQAISAAMPGVETGVVGFDDVAHLGTGGDYVAATRSDLGLRVVTGLVLVGLLFGSLFIADVAFAIFIGLVVMLGLSEFYGSLRRSGYLPLGIFGIAGGGGTMFGVWFHGPLAIPVGVLLTSTVTFFFYAFSQTRRDALSNAGLTVLGVGWVIAPIAFVIPIVRAQEHVTLVFAIVAVTAATDVGAFAFGRAWGKSPLAPVLSPNKTAEGLAGGVMLAMVVAAAIGFFELGPFDLTSGLALGAIAAFLAPIGDLAESMIKRSLGIKDMGSILPGHGGVLDRIDAFLFVIPAAWVFYETVGFLG